MAVQWDRKAGGGCDNRRWFNLSRLCITHPVGPQESPEPRHTAETIGQYDFALIEEIGGSHTVHSMISQIADWNEGAMGAVRTCDHHQMEDTACH